MVVRESCSRDVTDGYPPARESPGPSGPIRGALYPGPMAGGSALADEIEALFARPADEGVSLALVIQQHGEIVAERYGVRPATCS